MGNLVVARLQDGTMVKGRTFDVDPTRPQFHVRQPDGVVVRVEMKDLKALFFVRSLEGDPGHNENLEPNPGDPRGRGANVLALRFADGEIIVGMTIGDPTNRPFFYLTPVDPASNNRRMLVNRAAVESIEAVPAG